MKRLGLFDVNNEEIVEGDELNIKLSESDSVVDYYKFFKINKIIAKVLDSNGSVGVKVSLSYYSNNIKVNTTYQSDLDFICNGLNTSDQEKKKKDLEENLRKLNLNLSDNKEDRNISTLSNSIDFAHSFVHKSKEIINKVENKERSLALLSNNENLNIQLLNGKTLKANNEFLIELSEKAKNYVASINNTLYEDSIIEGDYTHLRVSPKKNEKYEFGLNFYGCDKTGKPTLITYQINNEKRNERFSERRKDINLEREKLISKGLTEKDANIKIRKQWDIDTKAMDKDKSLMDERPFGSLFISLTSSVDVIDVLLFMGSKITKIKNKKKLEYK
jgi:hypothetical protein